MAVRALYCIAIYRLYRCFGYIRYCIIHFSHTILQTIHFCLNFGYFAHKNSQIPMKFGDISSFLCIKPEKMYHRYISNIASWVSWYCIAENKRHRVLMAAGSEVLPTAWAWYRSIQGDKVVLAGLVWNKMTDDNLYCFRWQPVSHKPDSRYMGDIHIDKKFGVYAAGNTSHDNDVTMDQMKSQWGFT